MRLHSGNGSGSLAGVHPDSLVPAGVTIPRLAVQIGSLSDMGIYQQVWRDGSALRRSRPSATTASPDRYEDPPAPILPTCSHRCDHSCACDRTTSEIQEIVGESQDSVRERLRDALGEDVFDRYEREY